MLASFAVYIISIHAPVRGATSSRDHYQSFLQYFNPRSREGSDMLLPRPGSARLYFNPRSREGSDNNPGGNDSTISDFNPRSREGSDMSLRAMAVDVSKFQSTLP